MLGACEESIGGDAFLYARRGAGTRFLYQNVVVVVPGRAVGSSKWTFADRGIFHITRRTVRRPFKATLIADIRGERELKWGGKNRGERMRERGKRRKSGRKGERERNNEPRSRYSHKFTSIHPPESSGTR